MDQRNCRALCSLLVMPIFLFFSVSVDAYKNYTVADSLGWYTISEKPTVNYQKWADAKTFSLGDFLIFNTNTNHSIVQTYNATTYKLCNYDDAPEKDAIQWSSADPSNTTPYPVTVAVPLVKEGMNYFFSSDYDGDQCMNGQKFSINVTHGKGLPPSLKEPSDAMSPALSPDSGDDDSVPDTVIPSANFDHPKDMSDTEGEDDNEDGDVDKKTSNSNSSVTSLTFFQITLSSVLILLSLLCMS